MATLLLRLAAILVFLLLLSSAFAATGRASAVPYEQPDYGVLDRCHWTETPRACSQRMQALGRAGVRVVFNVRSSEDPLPDQRAFAAAAADAGLGVMWSLSDPAIYRAWAEGGDALARVPYMTHFARDCGGCANDRLLARAIGFWRSLPNTYGYYVADDTALNPATDPGMRALSARVRALDPDHPTHVATFSTYDAGGAQAERYQSSADRVLAELYPWHLPGWRADEPLRAIGERAADAQRVADAHGAESAFWLQSFTWADNDASADAVGAHCPDDWAAERCYARGHWPSAAELTELRDQVLLNARPRLIMWYYLDDIIGFVDGQRPGEGRWWGPTPEQAQRRWAAFAQMLRAPAPGPRGRIAGRARPRSRRVALRASGVEAPGGVQRLVWRVGRQRRTGARLRLRLRPGRWIVRLYAVDGWGKFRLVDRRRVATRPRPTRIR